MAAPRLRILVSGASGSIGTELVAQLRAADHDVLRLVRRAPTSPDELNWAPAARTMDFRIMGEVDAVVNLSGAPVAHLPWTGRYRKVLRASRLDTTQTLVDAMNMVRTPPRVLLNASGVGFYGDRPAERLTEDSAKGEGFLADLVADWEATSRLAPAATRVVQVRSANVIARDGMMAPLALTTQFGLGARFGTGGQHWPWISLHDEAAALVHLLGSRLAGPVNLAGPVPATSDRITRTLATRIGRDYRAGREYWARIPEWSIRAGLGRAGQELLLDSAKVYPTRLEADGFRWRHERVEDAIDAAFGR